MTRREVPDLPALPFDVREYAILSAEDTKILARNAPVWGEKWGVLYCLDRNGKRWTLWGNPKFVKALKAAAQKVPEEGIDPTYDYGPEWNGYGLPPALGEEFPLDQFEARYASSSWPDGWATERPIVFVRLPRAPSLWSER